MPADPQSNGASAPAAAPATGAALIDGTAMARAIREEAAAATAELKARGVTPGLTVVLVGDNPASAVYVRSKERACLEAGMAGETIRLPATTTQDELLAVVDRLNDDAAVHGILVQLPLPAHVDADLVIRRIRPDKDVDGFHPMNAGKLLIGESDGFVPCTPAGVWEMLVRSGIATRGAECVVVGRSNIVGKPMAVLMARGPGGGDATVTLCHRHTVDLAAHTRRADILIVAVGQPNLITAEMVKPGAVVIDVGMNRVPDESAKSGSRLVGDVDFPAVREVAGLITPVPGGVGPMTIAMLLKNTVRSAAMAAELTPA